MNSSHVSPNEIKKKIKELLRVYQNPEDKEYLLQKEREVDDLERDEKGVAKYEEQEEIRNNLDAVWKQLEEWELIKKQNTTDTIEIEFVNREKEKNRIDPSVSTSFYLIDAPSGYGKTRLLRQVQKELEEKGDKCFYISIFKSNIRLAEELMKEILKQLGITVNDEKINLKNSEHVGRKIADYVLNEPKHVIFLIDDGEFFDSSIGEFFNQFYSKIYDNIFPQKHLYVIFAGRYIHQWSERIEKPRLNPIILTPFNFKHVSDTLQSYKRKKEFSESGENQLEFVALMMHCTGGHPACIANFLKNEYVYPLKIKDEIEYYKTTENIINTILQGIINKCSESLYELLLKLSVFRKYNGVLLQKIIESDTFKINYKNANSLETKLLNTHLLSRIDGEFIQDDIVRRLLCIQLRKKLENQEFSKWCHEANRIYKEYLKRIKISSHLHLIALEALYQEMHYKYYHSEQTIEDRKKLYDKFFQEILYYYLNLLSTKDKNSVFSLREIFQSETDWEFRFILNFFLRKEHYTDVPYQRLLSEVDNFINTKL